MGGTVEDQNKAVVPRARVKAINLGTGLERETSTNDSGDFTIPLLPPSTYTVRVERDGFATVEISNVILNVGDQKALRIELKTGPLTAMVKIEGDASLIDESPAVGTVVDRQFVENLPLNGRSFQSLLSLSPGVVLTKTSVTSQGQFSVNGQRANANYFTVDGVSANIGSSASTFPGQSGTGALPGLGATGGTNNLVSVDALQEFKILTSTFAPEFGRTPGAQVSIVTRAGTKHLHGSLFDYVRNDILDATNWFANANRTGKPPLRQNDFGGVLGGPIYLPRFAEGGPKFYDFNQRLFFFLSYEGLRLRQPVVGLSDVPSLAARAVASPAIQPFVNAYPKPNGPDRPNGLATFNSSFSNPATLNATSIRIDGVVSDKLTLFGRYNYSPSTTVLRGGPGVTLNTLNHFQVKTKTLTLGATYIFRTFGTFDLRSRYDDYAHEDLFLMQQTETTFGTVNPPWKDLGAYLRNSPITYVDRVETPLMIIHGDMDPFGIEQGEEFFKSLYRQNKRARFVRYWGEDHTLMSPANVRDMWKQIHAWFDEFLMKPEGETRAK